MKVNLRISKRMAELLAALVPDGESVAKIAAEAAAGRAKAGAVVINVDHHATLALHGIARGRLSALNAALAATTEDADKLKLRHEHRAWGALVRQMPPYPEAENATPLPPGSPGFY